MTTKSRMSAADLRSDPLRIGIDQGTVLVIGKPGVGKSWLVHALAGQLVARGEKVAVLSTDMGQASVGVPTCLGLSLAPPWQEPAASWFIGDTTPVGNLLPTVVGTAQLVHYARRLQVRTLLIDTSGLVEGPVGRLLKYHKVVALGVVDHLVALQQAAELEPLLPLLRERCGVIHRLCPAIQARDRNPAERRQYREARFRSHFQGGALLELDARRLLNLDWTTGPTKVPPAQGTVTGLLSAEGFCLGLGLVWELRSDRLLVFTRWPDRDAVAWAQLGKIQLSPDGQQIPRDS